jgi:hypothetical protein
MLNQPVVVVQLLILCSTSVTSSLGLFVTKSDNNERLILIISVRPNVTNPELINGFLLNFILWSFTERSQHIPNWDNMEQ